MSNKKEARGRKKSFKNVYGSGGKNLIGEAKNDSRRDTRFPSKQRRQVFREPEKKRGLLNEKGVTQLKGRQVTDLSNRA